SRDIASQVIRMCTDVAETAGRAALRRIGSPGGLFLIVRLQAGSQPTLNVAGTNCIDLAEFAILDHLACLANERIAGVIVRDSKDYPGLLDDFHQFFRL